MKAMKTWIVALALAMLPRNCPADTGRHRMVGMEELTLKSDIVVVAEVIAEKDSGKPIEGDAILQGLDTTFHVSAVLKGDSIRELQVFHYRVIRGAKIMELQSTVMFKEWTKEEPIQYLLFLKKTGEGRYEPVTGQRDPDISVFEIKPVSRRPVFDPKQDIDVVPGEAKAQNVKG